MPLVLLFYTTYISIDLAHHEIIRAKVGKGGINIASIFYLQGILISVTMNSCTSNTEALIWVSMYY